MSEFATVEMVRVDVQLLLRNWRIGSTQESISEFRIENCIMIKAIDIAPTSEIISMLEEDVFPFFMTGNSRGRQRGFNTKCPGTKCCPIDA
jgi:hypothetical protein